MGEPCKIIPLYPAKEQDHDSRLYFERDVKKIIFRFARDYERRREITPPMRADTLKKFIATAFDFD